MMQVTEEFLLITNLQAIREKRAWLEEEFMLYQKLIQQRQLLLDLQIINIKVASSKARKELREANRRSDG